MIKIGRNENGEHKPYKLSMDNVSIVVRGAGEIPEAAEIAMDQVLKMITIWQRHRHLVDMEHIDAKRAEQMAKKAG